MFFPLATPADDMGFLQVVLAGGATFLIGFGIERIINYVRRRHDTVLKSSYDINTLFDNYNNLKRTVDDGNQKQNENALASKEIVAKLDTLVTETRDAKRMNQKMLELLYKHDTQIRLVAAKQKLDVEAMDSLNMFDIDNDDKEPPRA